MIRPIALTLAAALVASGCGFRDSRVNPANWFGGSQPAPQLQDAAGNPLIPVERERSGLFSRPDPEDNSQLVAEITGLSVERTPSGAIVQATGLASRQGAHDVELRRVEGAPEGVLAYEFRAVMPEWQTRVGPPATRTLRAARTVSAETLAGIGTIRVTAAANARESRRN
ncbi:hypothetical protein [Cribrihabitans neustonicus]|uniref:hypothetical protein n=1 Tax=Cribrihabitans neustonicus TaxID=1429085 RepID=UPI003B5CC0DE